MNPARYSQLVDQLALQLGLLQRDPGNDSGERGSHQQDPPSLGTIAGREGLTSEELAALETLSKRLVREHGGNVEEALATLVSEPPAAPEIKSDDLQTLGSAPASSAAGPASPAPLSRFEIVKLHERGGIGEVFLARDLELQREVALKQIRMNRADETESQQRFVAEAEITGRLEHPGIVPVYGLGRYPDGRPYYAMRFISGQSMRIAIDRMHAAGQLRDPIELRRLLARFIDVCQAIGFAHQRGIVHCDIKPSNVMLGEFGETLVVDWGLARSFPTVESPGSHLIRGEGVCEPEGAVVGTPQFMSPEQAAGEQNVVGAASDIFSLGATLYYLLVGRPPFSGTSVTDVLRAVRTADFRSPRSVDVSVPPALDAICMKAMAYRPEHRYLSAIDLAGDVQCYLDDRPVSAYREPLRVRVGRWMRGHTTLVATTLTAVLVSTALLAIGFYLLSQSYNQVSEARWAAEANAETANVQRREANRNFSLANSAVDRYFTTISEETLLDQPGLQELRKTLLMEARSFYDSLVKAIEADEVLQGEQVIAATNLARIIEETEGAGPALAAYRKAEQLASNLSPPRLELLAEVRNGLGRISFNLGELEAAEKYFRQAREDRQTFFDESPPSADHARKLANSIMNVGLVNARWGNMQDARTAFEQAQQIRRKALQSWPSEQKLLRDLGQGAYNLATLDIENSAWEQARGSLQQAIHSFSKVCQAQPRDLLTRLRLAQARSLYADVLAELVTDDAAVTAARGEAIAELRALHTENPAVKEFRVNLAVTLLEQGRGQLANERDQARQWFSETAALLAARPDQPATTEEVRDRGLALFLQAAASPLEQRVPLLEQAKQTLDGLTPEQVIATDAQMLIDAVIEALRNPEQILDAEVGPVS